MKTHDHATLHRQAQGYRPAAIMNYFAPCNEGRLEDADARGYASLAAEDEHLELSLRVDPGLTITEARFRATGSPALVAAGSVVTQLVRGRSLQAALSLTSEDLDCALGRLPDLRRYATRMAIIALRQAAFQAWEKHQPLPPRRV